jgi:hypothetical protein
MEDEDFMEPLVVGRGVGEALRLCGCSLKHRNALVGEGSTSTIDFFVIQAKYVAGMCTTLARIPVILEGSKVGTATMKKVEALVMCCHDREREGLELDAKEVRDLPMAYQG